MVSGRRTQIEEPGSSYTVVCHLRMSDDEYAPGRRPGRLALILINIQA
jgi:hypothetical protein